MNTIFTFKNLEVWQKSMTLAGDILILFDTVKMFALRDQVVRSAISVPSNIAEWFERKTSKDFQHFLHIARGSLSELETQLMLSQKVKILSDMQLLEFQNQIQTISKMLWSLIKKEQNDSQRS